MVWYLKKDKRLEWESKEKTFLHHGDKYDNIIRLYTYEQMNWTYFSVYIQWKKVFVQDAYTETTVSIIGKYVVIKFLNNKLCS